MTLHIDIDFRCPSCHFEFVPYSQQPTCPYCRKQLIEWYPGFIRKCCDSIRVNLEKFRSFSPPVWIPGSVADQVVFDVGLALNCWLASWVDLDPSELAARMQLIPAYDDDRARREDLLKKSLRQYKEWYLSSYLTQPHEQALSYDKPWLLYIGKLSYRVYRHLRRNHLNLELLALCQMFYEQGKFDIAYHIFRATAVKHCPETFEAYEGAIDCALDYWQQLRQTKGDSRWLLRSALRVYDWAEHRLAEDPRLPRLWADVAFMAGEVREFETAVHYYLKAIARYRETIQGQTIGTRAKVYKLCVCEDSWRRLEGLGGKRPRRQLFGESTVLDLHAGLAVTYDHLGEFENAIDQFRVAADSTFSQQDELTLAKWRLPFKIGIYGNSKGSLLRLAERSRAKSKRKLSSLFYRWFS